MSGQQGQEDKNSYGILWAIAAIFVIGVIVWHFWGAHIKYGFLKLKYWEISAISILVDDPDIVAWKQEMDKAYAAGRIMKATMEETTQIATITGEYLKYPIGIALCFFAWFLYRGHATMRFNKSYDMTTLAKQEKGNWPQISPVVELDLIKEDLNKGPWAIAQNPVQFGKQHKLYDVKFVVDKKATWRGEGLTEMKVHKDKTTQVFAAQMGPLWSGPDALPPHAKAMYAAFLLRAEHKPDDARELLGQFSRSAAKGVMDYTGVDEIIKKYQNIKVVKRCIEKHAYVLTVMATMLEISRLDGVFASADFLWLKPVDRRLWFMLNTVGRQVAVCEVGGPFAHWLAEKHMGRALTVPMVEEATKAYEKAIANMIYVPDEDEEGGDAKKAKAN